MSQALTRLMMHTVNAVQGRKERGATMVEYGLLVALIAMACILAVTAIGTNLSDLFDAVKDKLVVSSST